MKVLPHIRKATKWGGLAITALLVGSWLVSGWTSLVNVTSGFNRYKVDEGALFITFRDPYWGPLGQSSGLLKGGGSTRRPFGLRFRYWFVEARGLYGMYQIPLWPLPVATALAAGLAWRLDILARRREQAQVCQKCRYDRTGLPLEAKCPECGSPAST